MASKYLSRVIMDIKAATNNLNSITAMSLSTRRVELSEDQIVEIGIKKDDLKMKADAAIEAIELLDTYLDEIIIADAAIKEAARIAEEEKRAAIEAANREAGQPA